MLKSFITVAFTMLAILLYADTPGKPTMHDSKISFQNIGNYTHFIFYWQMENAGEISEITTDTSFYMSASRGAPVSYKFWGLNKTVSLALSTDTIEFHNYYSPDYVIIINKIDSNKISYTRKELSNKNEIVKEGNTDDITNKDLITDAKKAKRNHYIKMGLFILAGLGALVGIVWFIRRRKKAENV